MISLKHVKKIFDPRGIAGLHGIDLEIQDGEVFSVIGPTGCGKTTLLKILSNELSSDQGQRLVSGNIKMFSMSLPPQDKKVLNFLIDKIEENISEEKKIQLARDLADIFEFTFQLKQNVSELSSGQLQRVLVASAIIDRCDIFLMDEPFSHLDPVTKESILELLFQYLKRQSTTVVWVTHDVSEALRFSDRIGVMNFGKWEQIAKPLEITQHPRNLFTAKFLGHKNFLIVRFDHGWMTPWGLLESSLDHSTEAIALFSLNWEITPEGKLMTIKSRFHSTDGEMFILQFEDSEFWARFPFSAIAPEVKHLTLKPRLNEARLLPL